MYYCERLSRAGGASIAGRVALTLTLLKYLINPIMTKRSFT